jgi:hypothetical protein
MTEYFNPDPKELTQRSKAYLKWLRGQPCVYPDCGRIEDEYMSIVPAHQNIIGVSGTSIKPPDHYALALCAEHHAAEHHLGIETFWKGVDRKILIITHLIRYIQTKGT